MGFQREFERRIPDRWGVKGATFGRTFIWRPGDVGYTVTTKSAGVLYRDATEYYRGTGEHFWESFKEDGVVSVSAILRVFEENLRARYQDNPPMASKTELRKEAESLLQQICCFVRADANLTGSVIPLQPVTGKNGWLARSCPFPSMAAPAIIPVSTPPSASSATAAPPPSALQAARVTSPAPSSSAAAPAVPPSASSAAPVAQTQPSSAAAAPAVAASCRSVLPTMQPASPSASAVTPPTATSSPACGPATPVQPVPMATSTSAVNDAPAGAPTLFAKPSSTAWLAAYPPQQQQQQMAAMMSRYLLEANVMQHAASQVLCSFFEDLKPMSLLKARLVPSSELKAAVRLQSFLHHGGSNFNVVDGLLVGVSCPAAASSAGVHYNAPVRLQVGVLQNVLQVTGGACVLKVFDEQEVLPISMVGDFSLEDVLQSSGPAYAAFLAPRNSFKDTAAVLLRRLRIQSADLRLRLYEAALAAGLFGTYQDQQAARYFCIKEILETFGAAATAAELKAVRDALTQAAGSPM